MAVNKFDYYYEPDYLLPPIEYCDQPRPVDISGLPTGSLKPPVALTGLSTSPSDLVQKLLDSFDIYAHRYSYGTSVHNFLKNKASWKKRRRE